MQEVRTPVAFRTHPSPVRATRQRDEVKHTCGDPLKTAAGLAC